jgi:hypothetical protein
MTEGNYSNVGHRGPVYKGLGAMNPCDNLHLHLQLMLYREIMAFCSEIHTKHINTLCGQKVESLNVKPGGTYSDHWAFKG